MTPERLRELYGEVHPKAAAKVIDKLDHHCRDFIANSTLLVMATTNGDQLDVSPKGDPAGFVQVEDDTHVIIPDRLGNNRLDGMMNILKNPAISLLFMIPTVTETLRINGTAEISEDPDLCARFALRGEAPKTVLRVRADKILTHCGKALLRGGIWKPETWPQSRPIPTLYEMVRDHSGMTVEDTSQKAVDDLYEETLY
ncbi:MAG: pyridoxamine 5'-phosphate oxidase family protein [Rhizobiaceae bacterium]